MPRKTFPVKPQEYSTPLPPVYDPVEEKVTERHVYFDRVHGEGFIDYEYTKVGTNLMKKATHTGSAPGKDNHPPQVVPDLSVDELTTTGTTPVNMDVVKMVETTPGSGVFDKRIIVQETHNQPVLGLQTRVYPHPYKALYFGL